MGVFDSILWALQRPQQTIFQGAKAGADAFGEQQNSWNQAADKWTNKDSWGNAALRGLGTVASAVGSLGAAQQGMKNAWNPWASEDVRGGQLTEDLTSNQTANSVAGHAVDLTADPLSLVGGALAKPAGYAYRTANNLEKIGQYAPEAAKYIGNLGWRKYLQDIPVAEEGLPAVVKPLKDEIGGWLGNLYDNFNSLRQGLGSKGNPNASGYFAQGKNTIVMNPESRYAAQDVLGHEAAHWGIEKAQAINPQNAMETLNYFGSPTRYTKALQPYYGQEPARLGNELMARFVGGQWPAYPWAAENPMYRYVSGQAQKVSTDPRFYSQAPSIPLDLANMASQASAKAQGSIDDTWDYLLR